MTPPTLPLTTRNVVLMMVDGVRWQEIFRGTDPTLLAGVPDEEGRAVFGGATREERRAALLPFLWSTVAGQGTLIGDRDRDLGSRSAVTNGSNVSYPGYSETLCGFADPLIVDNGHGPNPNVTVFEWLARQPDWRGGVAAFAAWDGIGDVFNGPRAPFPVNVGYDPLTEGRTTDGIALLNRLKAETPRGWVGEPYDPITFHTAAQWIAANGPRLVFVGLGEPDEWAHVGDCAGYLQSIRRWDAAVRELWSTLQRMPQYRDSTTLILTCDHGRGGGPQWTDHAADAAGSEATWMAFLGPGTPSAGEGAPASASTVPSTPMSASAASPGTTATNGGIAASVARFLGYDYAAAEPRAGTWVEAAFR